jgi:YVTN family beta-propeller protein/VCBS repeat-containing protein
MFSKTQISNRSKDKIYKTTIDAKGKKVRSWIFFVAIGLFAACTSNNQESASKDSTEDDSVKVASPYPTIPVGKGPDALFLTPDSAFLYVANVEDTIISVIDTQSDQVVQSISGIRYPWGFSRLGDSDLVAASGWDKQVAIIDYKKHEIVNKKTFSSNLGGITSSSDGQFIYVVANSSKEVLKLNNSLDILDTYPTGSGPDGVGISKNDQKLYVTNTKDGTISIIETESGKIQTMKKGGKPELIHPNADNSFLLISNFHKNEAYVLSTVSDKIIQTLTDLNGPEEIVMSHDGKKIYTVSFNSGKVYVFDANTYTKLDMEYTVGRKPIGLEIISDSKAYVSNYGDNTVSVLELKN